MTALGDEDEEEDVLAPAEALHAPLASFLGLAPGQRSCVVLRDVLGFSIAEISALLELTAPAVIEALRRGRARLLARASVGCRARSTRTSRPSQALARYALLFNARDWEGVQSVLAEDVRLDLVSCSLRFGKREWRGYAAQYDAVDGWRLVPAWLDGREVLAVFRNSDRHPGYFIELTLDEGQVAAIRDFRDVPYIAREAAFELADPEWPLVLGKALWP